MKKPSTLAQQVEQAQRIFNGWTKAEKLSVRLEGSSSILPIKRDNFARGYFCAVAALLREWGHVTTDVRSLFNQGQDPAKADACDIELFREHGLMPANTPAAR